MINKVIDNLAIKYFERIIDVTNAKTDIKNGIAAFALYADNGYNGLNFDRPAFSLMQQDMRNGRLEKIVVTSLDRISRNFFDVIAFADCAAGMGISLEAVNGDHAALDCGRQLYAALTVKGGACR